MKLSLHKNNLYETHNTYNVISRKNNSKFA